MSSERKLVAASPHGRHHSREQRHQQQSFISPATNCLQKAASEMKNKHTSNRTYYYYYYCYGSVGYDYNCSSHCLRDSSSSSSSAINNQRSTLCSATKDWPSSARAQQTKQRRKLKRTKEQQRKEAATHEKQEQEQKPSRSANGCHFHCAPPSPPLACKLDGNRQSACSALTASARLLQVNAADHHNSLSWNKHNKERDKQRQNNDNKSISCCLSEQKDYSKKGPLSANSNALNRCSNSNSLRLISFIINYSLLLGAVLFSCTELFTKAQPHRGHDVWLPALAVSKAASDIAAEGIVTATTTTRLSRQRRALLADQDQSPGRSASIDLTRIVAVSGQTIEFQCPLASELKLPQTSAVGERTIIWRKDGQPLSQMNSTRVRLLESANSSSLTILQAQAKLDEATYECSLASAIHGTPAKAHHFQLKLLVPPRLAPFEFPTDAQVGMKVLLTCSALEGQQPVSFVWLRDNQIISARDTPKGAESSTSASTIASLGQVHRQQLADKFALSAHSAISLGQKSEYVLIGNVGGGGSGSSTTSQLSDDQQEPGDDLAGVAGHVQEQQEGASSSSSKTKSAKSAMQLSDAAIRIRQADDYSILSIEPLELKHSGRYTCSAQNEASRVSHSSQLVINAPPTFTVEPKDGNLVSGQSLVIECAASGQPRPQLSWLRARESNGGKQWDFVPIYENLRYTILPNGSLAINNATQREQGYYMCSAKNGFGPELTKLIKITVHEPARISTKYKLVEARIEERAQMTCSAAGESPLALTWLDKEGKPIDKTDKRFIIDTENSFSLEGVSAANQQHLQDSKVTSTGGESTTIGTIAANGKSLQSAVDSLLANKSESSLIIARTTRSDSGHYTCQASNKHGQDKMVINLLVQDVPDKVADLKVTNVTAQTISLRWQLGFTGNSPVTSYLVQYQSDDPLDDLLMSVARSNTASGQSASGTEMSGSTVAAAPTTVTTATTSGDFSPMRLYNHLFGQSSGDQDSKQGERDKQTGSGQQTTNSIKAALETLNSLSQTLGDLSITTADEAIDRTLVELTVEQSATNLMIKDLSPFCAYRLRLAGVNKIGLGEFSDWIRAKTEEAPPSGSALKISAAATGPNSIKLTWLPPDRRTWNGQLSRFHIGYRPIDSTFELNKSVDWSPPTLMQSIMLDADATTKKQGGAAQQQQQVSSGATNEATRLNPRNSDNNNSNSNSNNNNNNNNNTIVSTSKNPLLERDGSSPYALRQHLRQLLALQQRELVAHLTNLQRSTTYLVWIQAVNSRGAGPQSHAISVKTLDDVPPSAPALRVQSTSTSSITIAWSMLSNFVSPANQYSLFYRRVPPPSIGLNPTSTYLSSRAPTLSPGAHGGHSNSSVLGNLPHHLIGDNFAPIFNEPGPFIERSITSQQLMHSAAAAMLTSQPMAQNIFMASADGDNSELGHNSNPFVQQQHAQQQAQQQQHYQQFVYTLDQLECGSIYELYMTTRNSVGKSEPSAVVTTRTLGEPPLAPPNKNSLFAKIGAQDVLLNLASWSTGGCPLSHVSVRYKQLSQPVAAPAISHAATDSSRAGAELLASDNSSSAPAAGRLKLPSFSVAWPVSTSVPSNLLQAINQQQQQQQQPQHEHSQLGSQSRLFSLPAPSSQLHLISGDNGDMTQEGQQQRHPQLQQQASAQFPLKNLQASTGYELEIVAHNAAGHTTAQYEFVTAGVNGSRSGYTRREGVYRLDQRGQPIESGEQQLPSSAFGGDNPKGGGLSSFGSLPASQQAGLIQQLAPLALTLLCFVCLVISTTFCYYRLTASSWKERNRRMSMDGMQSVCSGSGGDGGHTSGDLQAKSVLKSWSGLRRGEPCSHPSSASSSSGFSKVDHPSSARQRHSELVNERAQSFMTSADSVPEDAHHYHNQQQHYCMREHQQQQQQQHLISATLNPKSASSFSQSVSMKDFNLIPPLGSAAAAATLNFKNGRNQMMATHEQQQQQQHRLSNGFRMSTATMGRTRLPDNVQASQCAAATYGNVGLVSNRTNLLPAYGQTTLSRAANEQDQMIYSQQIEDATCEANGFSNCVNNNSIYPLGKLEDACPKSLETSWTTTTSTINGMQRQQHNGAANYAVPAGYQQRDAPQSLAAYACDDAYGQGTIDACIQHLMSQQYQEQQQQPQQQPQPQQQQATVACMNQQCATQHVEQEQVVDMAMLASQRPNRCANHNMVYQGAPPASLGDQVFQAALDQQQQHQQQQQHGHLNYHSLAGSAGAMRTAPLVGPTAQSVIESSSSSSGIGVDSSLCASNHLDCAVSTSAASQQQTYGNQAPSDASSNNGNNNNNGCSNIFDNLQRDQHHMSIDDS